MSSLFRRRSQAADQSPAESDAVTTESEAAAEPDGAEDASDDAAPRAGVKPKAYTPAKGRATPKRNQARKRTAEPPPKDRKEAYRRMRGRQKEERAEARAAMMRGEDKFLPTRDRGPERTLVRNIVDARRNIGTWFFAGAVVILIGTWPGVPNPIRFFFDLMWVVLLVAVLVDSVMLARLIKRLVWLRYPDTTQKPGGLYFYGIMRSLTLRRMRIPAPQVKPGDEI
ncbi:MAG: DUF3043 domain-containing protein [Micromonosporaceae bacterium]